MQCKQNYRSLHASEGGIVFTARALRASAVIAIPPKRVVTYLLLENHFNNSWKGIRSLNFVSRCFRVAKSLVTGYVHTCFNFQIVVVGERVSGHC